MLKVLTVHGRFQPPLHINHWNYISKAFEMAKKVIVLITNPNLEKTKRLVETGYMKEAIPELFKVLGFK